MNSRLIAAMRVYTANATPEQALAWAASASVGDLAQFQADNEYNFHDIEESCEGNLDAWVEMLLTPKPPEDLNSLEDATVTHPKRGRSGRSKKKKRTDTTVRNFPNSPGYKSGGKSCFWYISEEDGGDIKVKISQVSFLEWAQKTGYRIFRQADGCKTLTKIVHETNSLAVADKDDMVHEASEIIRYMERTFVEIPDVPEGVQAREQAFIPDSCIPVQELKTVLLSFCTRGLNDIILNTLPHLTESDMLSDTRESTVFVFRNTGYINKAVNGTVNMYVLPHRDRKLVWASSLLEHDLPSTAFTEPEPGDFETFARHSCTERKTMTHDEKRYLALRCSLGYGLNRYNGATERKAVIFTESTATGRSDGRSGKTNLLLAVSQMRNTATVDGRSYDAKNRFAFQTVRPSTNVIAIDDAHKSFPFDALFSHISLGFTVERKGKDSWTFTPERSPKLFLASNFGISEECGSERDRQHNVELLPYYTENYRTIDDGLQKLFFSSTDAGRRAWDETDWQRYFVFMIRCNYLYHKHGLVPCPRVAAEIKKYVREAPESIQAWIEECQDDLRAMASAKQKILGRELYRAYVAFCNETNSRPQVERLFWHNVETWCRVAGIRIETTREIDPATKSKQRYKIFSTSVDRQNP